MSVYVDEALIQYARMLMCHMVADTREELLAMVDAIDVPRRWIQKAGTPKEHFDICKAKREKAVALGARPVDGREIMRVMRGKASSDPNHDADCPSRDGFYPENCECSHAPWRRPVSGGTSPLQSFAALGGLLAVVAGTDRDRLTPRQQQGLRGAEACIMLGAHSGKLDAEDLAILAKAGLVFGAVLAGER